MTSAHSLQCTGQTFPEPAGRLTDIGRQNGCIPRLDTIDEEAVGETAPGAVVGILLNTDGTKLGIAAVDVPADGLAATFCKPRW